MIAKHKFRLEIYLALEGSRDLTWEIFPYNHDASLYAFSNKKRIENNLNLVLPNLPESDKKNLIKNCLHNIGMTMFELLSPHDFKLSGKKARIAERTDGRAYDDEKFVSTIKDEVVVEEPSQEAAPSSESSVSDEAPAEVVKEEKVETAPAETTKDEVKEEAPAEEKPAEPESKS